LELSLFQGCSFKTALVSGLHFQQSKTSARNEKQKALNSFNLTCNRLAEAHETVSKIQALKAVLVCSFLDSLKLVKVCCSVSISNII